MDNPPPQPPGEPEQGLEPAEQTHCVTLSLMAHVPQIVQACGASVVFVYADALGDVGGVLPESLHAKACYVTKTAHEQDLYEAQPRILRVPNVPYTRISQVKIAVFLALSRGMVRQGDTIVFLSGIAGSGTLDTIMVLRVGNEYEMFTAAQTGRPAGNISPEVVERVIDIASELGSEGREGRPVGTTFVVGDPQEIMALTRQLILNPFRGYPEEERNILDRKLEETIKELATIDGAFVIREDGIVESCGTYIRTAGQEDLELPRGLGARHHAAASVTAMTHATAVTVSESTGTVTIFRGGKIVTEIEKPRTTSHRWYLSTLG